MYPSGASWGTRRARPSSGRKCPPWPRPPTRRASRSAGSRRSWPGLPAIPDCAFADLRELLSDATGALYDCRDGAEGLAALRALDEALRAVASSLRALQLGALRPSPRHEARRRARPGPRPGPPEGEGAARVARGAVDRAPASSEDPDCAPADCRVRTTTLDATGPRRSLGPSSSTTNPTIPSCWGLRRGPGRVRADCVERPRGPRARLVVEARHHASRHLDARDGRLRIRRRCDGFPRCEVPRRSPSTRTRSSNKRLAAQATFSAHVSKPYDCEALLYIVEKLDGREAVG